MTRSSFDTFIEFRLDETRNQEGFHIGPRDYQILSKDVQIVYEENYIWLHGVGLNYMIPRQELVSLNVSLKEIGDAPIPNS